MLEITPDKFHNLKGHSSPPRAFLFFVAEGDLTVFHFYDPAVSNSHLKNIRRQLLQASFTAADGLGINIPLNVPDNRVNLIEKPGFHLIPKFGAKDF